MPTEGDKSQFFFAKNQLAQLFQWAPNLDSAGIPEIYPNNLPKHFTGKNFVLLVVVDIFIMIILNTRGVLKGFLNSMKSA